ncbi:hypothetical protein BGW36DRAFT_378354 [Talaromyces proteolyticus]|uniref:Mid2 domain-containing protein n=1 Tax=Talaromyces proteolyticus TaxID=1131652 RepID=A0AAD4PVY9_9EURO|nr:uncharacterized protein BGW36DRAFT_378354 [Talaromyces proteolyticus]KAH8697275.1 hypothetical protein BGW36DRAFT_378354 [Talaromyces proteolyticus]
MHRSLMSISILLLTLFASNALATVISTFSDDSCKDSYKAFNGPNGYPNGTCTPFRSNGAFGSFQVAQEDSGCGVTIYGNDSDVSSPCSSTTLQLAQIATCYNSSWVYFSIDNCQAPVSSTVGASSTATAPATSSTNSSSGGSSTNVGAIVGGVVGGVVGLGLIALAGWFLWLRQRPRRANASQYCETADFKTDDTKNDSSGGGAVAVSPFKKVHELPPESDRIEMSSMGASTKYELSSIGGNDEVVQKPKYFAELPGHEAGQ